MKRALFLLLFFGTMLSGCGDDAGTTNDMSVPEFFSSYLKTLCEASAQCNGGFVNAENTLYCPDTIRYLPTPFPYFHRKELVIFNQKYDALKRAQDNGLLKIDREQADICFNIIRELKPCNPLAVSLFDIVECNKAFIGQSPPHTPCFQDEECEGGWCDLRNGQCPGTCMLYRSAGQSCNDKIDKCEPGYACRDSGCSEVTQGEAGDPCISDEHCADYLYCKVVEGDATGLCLRKKEEGKACVTSEECVVGLECVNNICQGTAIENNAGGACDNKTKFCNYFSRLECAPSGVCQQIPNGVNQLCSSTCEPPLYCSPSQSKCMFQSEGGQPCESNDACKSHYCKDGVCIVPDCVPVVEAK